MKYSILVLWVTTLTSQNWGLTRAGNFDIVFPTDSSSGVVITSAQIPKLANFSFCIWLNGSFPHGIHGTGYTVFSYYYEGVSAWYMLNFGSGPAIFMHGKWLVSSLKSDDNQWHHMCYTLNTGTGQVACYTDGVHTHSSPVWKGGFLKGGGCFIIGQKQGSLCANFTRPYYGSVSQLNIWSRQLDSEEIRQVYTGCNLRHGDVFNWSRREIEPHIRGRVIVTSTTTACESNSVEGMFSTIPNMVLKGHMISTHWVADELSCAAVCLRHPYCQSFNLFHRSNGLQMCELINVKKEGFPASFIPSQGVAYYERLMKHA